MNTFKSISILLLIAVSLVSCSDDTPTENNDDTLTENNNGTLTEQEITRQIDEVFESTIDHARIISLRDHYTPAKGHVYVNIDALEKLQKEGILVRRETITGSDGKTYRNFDLTEKGREFVYRQPCSSLSYYNERNKQAHLVFGRGHLMSIDEISIHEDGKNADVTYTWQFRANSIGKAFEVESQTKTDIAHFRKTGDTWLFNGSSRR